MRKRLITGEKISQRANEKENKQQPAGQPVACDKEQGLRCELVNNSQSCLSDQNSNLNKSAPNSEQSANGDLANQKCGLSMELPSVSDPMEMHTSLSASASLKQKLVSLNNSKFVIEEDVENEELANPILNDEFNDSDYDYDGEDLSENDENYFANGSFRLRFCLRFESMIVGLQSRLSDGSNSK